MKHHRLLNKICFGFSVLMISVNSLQAEEHIVKVISDYDKMRMVFEPQNLQIAVGDTVTWVNEADEDHNMLGSVDRNQF